MWPDDDCTRKRSRISGSCKCREEVVGKVGQKVALQVQAKDGWTRGWQVTTGARTGVDPFLKWMSEEVVVCLLASDL